MAAPSKGSTKAPGQRRDLPRKRKSFRVDFRLDTYESLTGLPQLRADGTPEPLVEVLERLIKKEAAQPKLPYARNEFVRGRAQTA